MCILECVFSHWPFLNSSLHVPAAQKHSYSMLYPPPCLPLGMVLVRLWTVSGVCWMAIKELNFCFIRSENPFSHAFKSHLSFYLKLLLSSYSTLGIIRWPAGCSFGDDFRYLILDHFLEQGPSCLGTQFGQTANERVLEVPSFFHIIIIMAAVLLGTVKALEMVLYPCCDLLDFIGFHGLAFALTCSVNCGICVVFFNNKFAKKI